MSKRTVLSLALAIFMGALCFAQEAEISPIPDNKGSLGLGYGTPYGGLGLNADVYFFDTAAVTIGVGSYGYTAGVVLGVKGFYGPSTKTWRPQAVLLYGTNRAIYVDREPEEPNIRESCSGFTAGLGSQFMFGKKKRHGFDFDILYVISSEAFDRRDYWNPQLVNKIPEIQRFGFSLGYRYAFDLKY
ncbi:MAG: hypothetical protein K0B87_04975 [Candidatus Syntrophosphaera sp.]|nr:hypothetical protein [Candidatus Syntrophosphaera sp.]